MGKAIKSFSCNAKSIYNPKEVLFKRKAKTMEDAVKWAIFFRDKNSVYLKFSDFRFNGETINI